MQEEDVGLEVSALKNHPVWGAAFVPIATKPKVKPEVRTAWIPMAKVVGAIMRNYRTDKGIQHDAVAKQLNISPNHHFKLETGEKRYAGYTCFTLAHTHQLAKLYGVTSSDILQEIEDTIKDLEKDGVIVVLDDRESDGYMYDQKYLFR